MVKVHSIEMIEHSARSTPNVTAHADMPNGALVGIDYLNKVTTAPATSKELFVVMNVQTGDDEYATAKTINQGEYANLFNLTEWAGKELDVTAENITDEMSAVTVGNTLTFDATTFKFKKGTVTSGVKFTVTAKGGTGVPYVTVLIEIV